MSVVNVSASNDIFGSYFLVFFRRSGSCGIQYPSQAQFLTISLYSDLPIHRIRLATSGKEIISVTGEIAVVRRKGGSKGNVFLSAIKGTCFEGPITSEFLGGDRADMECQHTSEDEGKYYFHVLLFRMYIRWLCRRWYGACLHIR